MRSSQPVASPNIITLREKARLCRLDREVYVSQIDARFKENGDKRRTLSIGNVCLRDMTKKLNDMPITLNAAIFKNHPPEDRNPMEKLPLKESIFVNDSKLFKLGKRLLKQDHIGVQKEKKLVETKEKLQRTIKESMDFREDYEKRCELYLHKQAMVEDSHNRMVSAKLIHQRLQKILDELNQDIKTFPLRIDEKEKKVREKAKELDEFEKLRDRAKQYLIQEVSLLTPLDKELASVSANFERLITTTKDEIDYRRKKGALGAFLQQREANQLSFQERSSLDDLKLKKANKSISQSYDALIALIDATLVSDAENVVDCFLDQAEVTEMLNAEKAMMVEKNKQLNEKLAFLQKNNQFFKFNSIKNFNNQEIYQKAVAEELEETRKFENADFLLRKQDTLVSSLHLTVHSVMEKLRPIKLEDPMNRIQGDLLADIQSVIKKAERMMVIIRDNAVPIGMVRPIMLHMFKEKRLPPDSLRLETSSSTPGGSMSAYQVFEADQPGLVTRDMLKTRAIETSAKHDKTKKSNKKKK